MVHLFDDMTPDTYFEAPHNAVPFFFIHKNNLMVLNYIFVPLARSREKLYLLLPLKILARKM